MQSEKELVHNQNPVNQKEEEDNSVHSEDTHEEELNFPDISNFSIPELTEELKNISIDHSSFKYSTFLKDVKTHFDSIVEELKSNALNEFLKDGGTEEGFEFKKSEDINLFEANYGKLRAEISDKASSIELEKEKNLKAKYDILEKLRELTSGEESSKSFSNLKELQNEWKNTGPVPSAKAKELWANYNALVEMFYNNRSIYFELKELDRKKNLESKIEVVERCEGLSNEENVAEAIKELKKLHEEFKNIGPVPKEEQEPLWVRFKEASDKVYSRRAEIAEINKGLQEDNLIKKKALIETAKKFQEFETSEINLWKDKTKEILELQNQWKSIGPVPKDDTKTISKEFWAAYKGFFKKKEVFFKQLEHQKKDNLVKKLELCELAESLKDSTDMGSTTETLKKIQDDWMKIGPVPVKEKEVIFKRFKAACDHFFNRKREQFAEQEKEYEQNLDKKNAVIDKILKLSESKDKNADKIRDLQDEFNSIGFVPRKSIKDIKERYKNAVETFLKNIDSVEADNKDNLKLELEVSALKSEPNARKKIGRKETDLIKRIQGLKNDIQSWTTNIEFLANSPKAEKLKEQIQGNIKNAENELDKLEEQLYIIKNTK